MKEKKDNETWEQVAIRLRGEALQKHLKRQYEDKIVFRLVQEVLLELELVIKKEN